MKKSLIIYHGEDNDGLFSMAICYIWLTTKYNLSGNLIDALGTNYNKLSDMLKSGWFDNLNEKYDRVVVTDVSFNETEEMLKLYEMFEDNFFWFDHHKSIIDWSNTNDLKNANGLRDIKHSALYNAWKYCFSDIAVPHYLELLSAYDSFSFDENNIDKEFATNVNQGTTNKFELNVSDIIKIVKKLFNKSLNEDDLIDETYKIGKAYNDMQDKRFKRIINEYGDMSWVVNGRKACMLELQEQTSSDAFKSLIGSDVKNGLVIKHQKNGNYVMNLYNVDINDSFHCGDYLKEHFQGGGHAGAAGCTISLLQYLDIVKQKKI